MIHSSKKNYLIFLLILIVVLLGVGIDMMDIDASQYASISREMLEHNNMLQIFDAGKDYLDKPPFLFWVSALSIKIFGVNNWGYKLPSILFSILAVFSTYSFAKLFYNKRVAVFSAIVLASSQGFILMNHDIRTDTILMSWVIFSIWQLTCWFKEKKITHLLFGCIGIAGGMMTKGPIALLLPIFGFGVHFFLQRRVSMFFKWQHLIGVAVIAIFLLPMSWGLYQQFDLHPNKVVNGDTHVSGLIFFYWTQSFGRITGESNWNNHAGFFFLLQNMLWSFMPWILFFLIGFFLKVKRIIKNKFRIENISEAISIGVFVFTYIALGLSKYQLPHYIFVVFPFASIITADYIINQLLTSETHNKNFTILYYFHFVIFVLLWIVLIFLLAITFESIIWIYPLLAIVSLCLLIYFFAKKYIQNKLIAMCLFTIIGVNLFLNGIFYPTILKYQAGNNVGRYIIENKIPLSKIALYKYSMWRSLNYYAQGTIKEIEDSTLIHQGDYLIIKKNDLIGLDRQQVSYQILFKGFDYPVTKLTKDFLNSNKRKKSIQEFSLIFIKRLNKNAFAKH